MTKEAMTYAGSGVDYGGGLDAHKLLCAQLGRKTYRHLERLRIKLLEESIGESAIVIEFMGVLWAFVVEGLGTKNLVEELRRLAEHVHSISGRSLYGNVGQCAVAMIVNDLATVGARAAIIGQHLAVGSNDWFKTQHAPAFAAGWAEGCDIARVCWPCGETATLIGLIMPQTAEISGAALGLIGPKTSFLRGGLIEDGDAIVLIGSSGPHANGITLMRKIADKLPDGYLTQMPDGRLYGEAILDPTVIYAPLVEDCLDAELPLHYAVHISGHGWRKLMRATQPFKYLVDKLPKPQPVFSFIQEQGPVEEREMYGNYNMGAGFALYLPEAHASRVIDFAEELGMTAWVGGHIEKTYKSSVVLVEKSITFHAEELEVR